MCFVTGLYYHIFALQINHCSHVLIHAAFVNYFSIATNHTSQMPVLHVYPVGQSPDMPASLPVPATPVPAKASR